MLDYSSLLVTTNLQSAIYYGMRTSLIRMLYAWSQLCREVHKATMARDPYWASSYKHCELLCRYIKAYWSKMKIRDTVISEEQERMLLERILSEEENEREDVSGHVTVM